MRADRVRKSVGAETTFERDLLGWDEVAPALAPVFAKVWDACIRLAYLLQPYPASRPAAKLTVPEDH